MKNTDLITRYFLTAHDAAFDYAKARLIRRVIVKNMIPHEVAVFQLDGSQLCRVVLAGQVFYGEVSEVDDYLKFMPAEEDRHLVMPDDLQAASEHFHEAQRWPDAIAEGVARLIAAADAEADEITAEQTAFHAAQRDTAVDAIDADIDAYLNNPHSSRSNTGR